MYLQDNHKEEFYFLKNVKTGLFFVKFSREIQNKPIWTDRQTNALAYKNLDALRVQRRLENLYSPAQKIVLVEKT